MSIADHIGRPAAFEALGQTWILSRWTRAVWSKFIDYAKTVLPDPREEAKAILAVIPESDTATRVQIVKEALETARRQFQVGSPELTSLLGTPDGTAELLRLLLEPNHPGVTLDTCYAIAMSGPEGLRRAIEQAAGQTPGKGVSPGETEAGAITSP